MADSVVAVGGLFLAIVALFAPSHPAAMPNASASLAAPARPPVIQRPIPFPVVRKREMRGYARRHYALDDFRLRHPRVIVEHYTATNTFRAAFDTFARDVPDVELRELPGTCAHYVIDRDGGVYQLVSTRLMCRHAVGLNYTAIGIEHVGRSDAALLGDRRQLRASLALTRYLQSKYGVRRLRNQTHGDLGRSAMKRYRRAL